MAPTRPPAPRANAPPNLSSSTSAAESAESAGASKPPDSALTAQCESPAYSSPDPLSQNAVPASVLQQPLDALPADMPVVLPSSPPLAPATPTPAPKALATATSRSKTLQTKNMQGVRIFKTHAGSKKFAGQIDSTPLAELFSVPEAPVPEASIVESATSELDRSFILYSLDALWKRDCNALIGGAIKYMELAGIAPTYAATEAEVPDVPDVPEVPETSSGNTHNKKSSRKQRTARKKARNAAATAPSATLGESMDVEMTVTGANESQRKATTPTSSTKATTPATTATKATASTGKAGEAASTPARPAPSKTAAPLGRRNRTLQPPRGAAWKSVN
ncbi:hypothetical protein SEPCBS119000_006760 [Sporothrix epigloea]|uniref:Uncharacterized protein n=1 Tax=Sporothrix epigloea TaxID=1892477 RepID=A0ABP0E561_9PEZI